MFIEEETIKKIKSLGLNTYEVKIWTALLSRGVSTAGELSDIANVPRSRSYDVLESLEKKGFVATKLGKPIKYLAIPPKEVLERVKTQIKNTTENNISKISSQMFTNLINKLQDVYDDTNEQNTEMVAVLKGHRNIQKHLEFLFKNSQRDFHFSLEKDKKKYGWLQDKKGSPKDVNFKMYNHSFRICVTDGVNSLLFPVSEEETHPDYDFCIWIKNKQATKFLQTLISS